MAALTLSSKEKRHLDTHFYEVFGSVPQRYFSAPGRTVICGNHTEHQRGRVLTAAINLDTIAAVRITGRNMIRVQSNGDLICQISLDELTPKKSEIHSTAALIRGIAARFVQLGCPMKGFDVYCKFNALPGFCISSAAAIEVLMGTICNCLFFDGRLSAIEIAQVGQYAEKVFSGRTCDLLDQVTSSNGGMVYIDFQKPDAPEVKKVNFDLYAFNHSLCMIDTGADYADMTDGYAVATRELKDLCGFFGDTELLSISKIEFYNNLSELRKKVGDRAVLRAIHIYDENQRVALMRNALEENDFSTFLDCITESGLSSWRYLQNVIPVGRTVKQEVALALAVAEKLLNGRGACCVHGSGFSGTIQAFVPNDLLEDFKSGMETIFGEGSCHVLSVRTHGGVEMTVRK